MLLTCETCGAEFNRQPKDAKRAKHHYCSRACFGLSERGERNHAYQGGLVVMRCAVCGADFHVKPMRAATAKFCSRQCQTIAFTIDPPRPHNGIRLACDFCGASILRTPGRLKPTNYCSRTCANLAHSLRMRGKGNGRYVHGQAPSLYPAEFRVVRQSVRDRDGSRCRKCGMTEEDNGYALSVHHVNYQKTDNRMDNLVTLCRWCHGSMHGKPESRERWTMYWSRVLSASAPPSESTICEQPRETTLLAGS